MSCVRLCVRDIIQKNIANEFQHHSKESRGVLGSRASKQASKQASKKTSKLARRQTSMEALRGLSVGAKPYRGLF